MPSFGYFQLTVHEAKGLQLPKTLFSKAPDPFAVMIVQSKPSDKDDESSVIRLERKTSVEWNTLDPVWEESHLFRCNADFDVRVEVRSGGVFGDRVLCGAGFVISEAKDGWFQLYTEEGTAAGELRLSINFTPARSSIADIMSYTQTVTTDVASPLSALQSPLVNDTASNASPVGSSNNQGLSNVLRKLIRESRGKLRRGAEDTLLEACTRIDRGLKSSQFLSSVCDRLKEYDVDGSGLLEFEELRGGLGDMLKADWGSLPGAPRMSDTLLAKQFAMFDKEGTGFLKVEDFARFIEVVMIWGLHQCILFNKLIAEFGIEESELRAIYRRFERYDPDLSGCMEAKYLGELLTDMNAADAPEPVVVYTPSEIDLVLTQVVPDQGHFVHFDYFCAWWTA